MFRNCVFLLGGKVGYCLKFKDWIKACPPKCGEYIQGEVGDFDEVERKNYNIECLHFTRDVEKRSAYFCTLLIQEEPFCDACQFPIYKEVPVKGNHIRNP
ncbi:MAG: hypothetical protein ACFFB5_18795 [Promethearchaeota archaeon]